jgi:signal transduction histidine kinase/ActR/RegA family two-component response regulator
MKKPDGLAGRVLILTPTGRDGELIADMLHREDIASLQCRTVDGLASAIEEGAATALVAEEALAGVSLASLLDALARQPSWSDLPLLFLTSAGEATSMTFTRLLAMFDERANITILERPVQALTLRSSIRSAIRARRRQYEVRDYIAERARSDEKLLQKQKLESLGILAGGVAHDFNNLLTGILGNASLALDYVPEGSPAARMLGDVVEASERAAHLTKQMLAYAGKGRFFVQSIDLSEVVREISHLIKSSIPKNAQIRLDLPERLPCIEADGSQIQQLVMNLVINAAEAIPEGETGNVVVTTRPQHVDESDLAQLGASGEIAPGEYVALEVHDTGVGMDEPTLSRIFDPFFTTKFAGRGLGLAATQGIVRGHKGLLKVYSMPGQGSTFKVLFPAMTEERAPVESMPQMTVKPSKRSGTVLVIDDEEVVRRSAKAALEQAGFDIVLAENGIEGIQLFQALAGKISLVLLDLTMPGPGGEEVLRQIKAAKPQARVILSSGYNEVEVIQRFTGKGLAGFLQKPYTAAALIDKVDRALNQLD